MQEEYIVLISDMMVIGEKLYKIRKKTGLSQEEAAWQAGISDRAYANIERGTANPRLDTLIKICNVLGITPDDVLTDGKDSPPMRQEEILLQIDTLPPRDKNTACRILEAYIKGITSI